MDTATWLARGRDLLQREPAGSGSGSVSRHVALLRWAIAVGEMADVIRAAAGATTGGVLRPCI